MIKKRAKFRTSKLVKRKRRRFIFRVVLYSVFSIVLIFGLSRLSSADFLSIEKVEVSGNKAVSEESVKETVLKETEGKYFYLFSKKNIFLYPKKRIKSALLDNFKRISNVEVGLRGFSVLETEVSERKPVAFWCNSQNNQSSQIEIVPSEEESENQSQPGETEEDEREDEGEGIVEGESVQQIPADEECFFVDHTGFIFSPASDFSEEFPVRYIGEIFPDRKNPVGSRFFSQGDSFKLINFLNLLTEMLFAEPTMILKNSRQNITVFLDTDTQLILSLDDNLKNSFENMVILITEPEFSKDEDMSIFSPFEYLDLRFGDKILYKLKDQAD